VPDEDLSLVVMAAGVGSRFGGNKQLAEVGPAGEALLDYTIHDARRAGFDQIVLIVRRALVEPMSAQLRRFHADAADFRLVCQDEDDLAPARAKPWGTGHAVLSVRHEVPGSFAVVNADDYYGAEVFPLLADALRTQPGYHLVAYRLDQTLSQEGAVSRGVCTVDRQGRLQAITEEAAIARTAEGRIVTGGGRVLAEDTPVSMNLWGLPATLFGELERRFTAFLAVHRGEEKAEFLLPEVIDTLVAEAGETVAVHRTNARWLGVTYPGDLEGARQQMASLVRAGSYSSPLR
jgi:NDP-sugar pyrophosphorylase family protein